MKKLKFELDPSMRESREQQLERMRKNSNIKAFVADNNIPRDIVYQNAGLLELWEAEKRKCDGCTGLDHCRQSFRGRVLTLTYGDGQLMESYEPCRKAVMQEAKRAHASQYRVFHGTPQDLEVSKESLTPRAENNDYVKAYMAVFEASMEGKGLLLYGPVGTGKTSLVLAKANRAAWEGRRVAFVKMPQLIQDQKLYLEDRDYRERLNADLKHVDFLVLDDLGGESITAWTRDEILLPLLDYRMQAGKTTWFTSNYTMEELKTKYTLDDEAAASRIMERIRVLAQPMRVPGLSLRI